MGSGFYKADSFYVRAVRGGQVQPENRFVDNHDGTVSDTSTCLHWQQATPDVNNDGFPDPMDSQSALAYVENLSLGGHDDWRLPDLNELRSIVDYSGSVPTIDISIFPGTQNSPYWSSTDAIMAMNFNKWAINFWFANDYPSNFIDTFYVRSVRGVQCKANIKTNASGDGEGVVVSIPGNINYRYPVTSSAVSTLLDIGTEIVLTATADVGFVFWQDCTSVGGTPLGNGTSTATCSFSSLDASKSVTAIFTEMEQYTVSASAGTGGSVSPVSLMVPAGSTAIFTVTPDTGFTHDTSVGGTCPAGTWNGTIYTTGAISDNCTANFSFVQLQYTVNSSVSGGNGTIDPAGDQLVNYGATPSFTLEPDPGYHVYQVTGTCGGILDGLTFTTNPVSVNCTVIAVFSSTSYTVTSSVLGGNGTIEPDVRRDAQRYYLHH
jgi:hypothetical protein